MHRERDTPLLNEVLWRTELILLRSRCNSKSQLRLATGNRATNHAWIKTLSLRRGDRVEIFDEPGTGFWWGYQPAN